MNEYSVYNRKQVGWNMIAEIICVGTELLLGDVINTNAPFLASELSRLGIDCYHQVVVGDNPERLAAQISESLSRSDLVILTGGLGPTYDDLTKETVAKVLGRDLVEDPAWMMYLEQYFAQMNRTMSANNRKQAMIIRGAMKIDNRRGTAPGMIVESGHKIVVLLPGPPVEMQPMYRNGVKPLLEARTRSCLHSDVIHFIGIGESELEHQLDEKYKQMKNPTVAPYVKAGEVELRVSAKSATSDAARALTNPVVKALAKTFAPYIYSINNGSIETVLVRTLKRAGLSVSAAESCTGGLLMKRITDVPGASSVFPGGYVTYSETMKQQTLGIDRTLIQTHGVVSEAVALAMAKGAAQVAGTRCGVGITGIAGPEGGSEQLPVGTVWIACVVDEHESVQVYHFGQSGDNLRSRIRNRATTYALMQLLKLLEGCGYERID